MRALVCHDGGALSVDDVPVPEPGPHDAILRVSHCGICGTDLHFVFGQSPHGPLVLGHEYSGVVVAVGPGVRGWAPGDRVVGGPGLGCGACARCRAGTPHLCPHAPRGGAGNGSWATHRRVDAGHLFRVPDGLDLRTAALAEPTGIALRAVRRSGARAGDRVLVTGAGSIGLLTVAILAELDVDVDVSEPSANRRTRALLVGARAAVEPGALPRPDQAVDIADEPYAAVIECSGRADAIEHAVALLDRGGTLVLVGIGLGSPPALDATRLILSECTVTGSLDYSRGEFAEAIALLASGRLPIEDLLEPDDVPLDRVADVLPGLASGEIAGKVLVAPAPVTADP
jgi:(R,R)-butanediol dehydrogenase/meso-butanediol dehydrogenase/diacetyl reductase